MITEWTKAAVQSNHLTEKQQSEEVLRPLGCGTLCPGNRLIQPLVSLNLTSQRFRSNILTFLLTRCLSISFSSFLLTEQLKCTWQPVVHVSMRCNVSFHWLTEWLTPHIKTLSTGSLARNTFTFCCTKCFFFVLVLGARITIGLEVAPELPREAMTANKRSSSPVESAGAGGDTSSW